MITYATPPSSAHLGTEPSNMETVRIPECKTDEKSYDLSTVDVNDLLGPNFELSELPYSDEIGQFDVAGLFSDYENDQNRPISTEEGRMEPEASTSTSTVSDSRPNKAPTFLPINETEQSEFVDKMKNKNTVRKTEGAARQFSNFLMSRGEGKNMENLDPTALDVYLGAFILAIRKSDGSQYEPDTLTSYHRSLDRYLREKNYPKSILLDKEFTASREVLKSKRKELKQMGKGSKPNKSEPLTENEQGKLENLGLLGNNSPRALRNKMWFQNTLMFGLRGGQENRKLCWGDIELKTTEDGHEYLEYNERDTKTRTGENSTHLRAFKPKQFATPNDPEHCPVLTYKHYRSRRPESTLTHESPFYLGVNFKRLPNSQIWYKNQPLGENTLRSIMKNMATVAELPGRKTNHSARKTTMTRLLHNKVDPTTIIQLSGHKNVQSLNSYAVASRDMQKEMSDILSGARASGHRPAVHTESRSAVVLSSHAVNTCSPPATLTHSATRTAFDVNNSRPNASEFLRDATLSNCTITVNNNYGPTAEKRRRVRVIDSDSE